MRYKVNKCLILLQHIPKEPVSVDDTNMNTISAKV